MKFSSSRKFREFGVQTQYFREFGVQTRFPIDSIMGASHLSVRQSERTKNVAAKPKPTGIEIAPIREGVTRFALLGTSALVMNRVSEKAKRVLLLPGLRRRSKADRAGSLKHSPMTEYRDSVYKDRKGQHTRLVFPSPAFKGAMASAALDLPGTAKKEIGRLVAVDDTTVPIFGIPELFMAIVRNSDQNHTPDVRTRAIIPNWATIITVRFVEPNLTFSAVMNLLAAAGILSGVGDGRREKGKLSFGAFRICNEDDPAFINILRTGGAKEQDEALLNPEYFDEDSAELLTWFDDELQNRVKSGSEVMPDDEPETKEGPDDDEPDTEDGEDA
jgi:hypothetical protein